MPHLPAFCNNCDAVFNSGIVVGNSATISMTNCIAGPCPQCGSMGYIPDGVFSVLGNTIRLLSGPNRTINDLKKLSSILLKAQKEKLSKEQVELLIEDAIPELKSFSNILPKTRNDLYQFITLILTAITLLISAYGTLKKDGPSADEVQKMINNSIEESMGNPAESSRPRINKQSPSKIKVGRNQPCYCGSGKKYKKCCYLIS